MWPQSLAKVVVVLAVLLAIFVLVAVIRTAAALVGCAGTAVVSGALFLIVLALIAPILIAGVEGAAVGAKRSSDSLRCRPARQVQTQWPGARRAAPVEW